MAPSKYRGRERKRRGSQRSWKELGDSDDDRAGPQHSRSAPSQEKGPQQTPPPTGPALSDVEAQQLVTAGPALSKRVLIAWRLSIILPFLAAGCLLYLLTCSAPSWRANWSVVRIALPADEFKRVYQVGQSITGTSDDSTESTQNQTGGSASRRDVFDRAAAVASTGGDAWSSAVGGYMTVNMWGWCLKSAESTTTCSSESMWFNMDSLLGTSSSTASHGLSADTFNSILVHAMIVHGLAMVAAMLSVIPLGLTTWRVFRSKDTDVQGGWFEYGSILAACLLCLISWIIDRCLEASVSSKLSDYKVTSGSAAVITGVSAILLAVAFLLSAVPVLYFHMKRQSQLLRYWNNLEDYDEAVARQDGDGKPESPRRGGDTARKRSKTSTGKKLRNNRLTRMLFGGGYDSSTDGEERRGRRHRRGRGGRRERRRHHGYGRR
ncbi:hypothetical protein IAT38_006262 [Cryptococcus sp. DSM 104549]